MEENKARALLVEAGMKLLETGLVARTWGNISVRLDEKNILITPSGLDYTLTKEEDIVPLNIETGEWQGARKPSGERKVHIAAYKIYPDVNFVVHTHQNYASAISLAGFTTLDITQEEKEALGGIAVSGYGLPGTKKLTKNVAKALSGGAKVVLMEKHGALICASSFEDAMEKAKLLEEICKRNIKGNFDEEADINLSDRLLSEAKAKYKYCALANTAAVVSLANAKKKIYAQLDDMAQMIGRKIPVVTKDKAVKKLEKYGAVLVPGVGAIVKADAEDDTAAMKLLVDKAAVSAIHTAALKKRARLSLIDCALMNLVYKMKYSKQKNK